MTRQAVVLARGLGRRMQQPDASATLTAEQQRAADAGSKAMMPVGGRPFMDFVLHTLAEAGIADVALVVAPDHGTTRRYYMVERPPQRIRLGFVVQPEPIGTANAILAAEAWTAGEPFLVTNADNLYPVETLRQLAALGEPGLPAFARDELVRTSNIPDARVQSFALLDIDADGYLTGIVEKPTAERFASAGASAWVSMNCWRFDTRIFQFCREVPPSSRGEVELPEAVGLAVRHGLRFRTFPAQGAVLDLSRRADAAAVARRLATLTPRP